jgi:hypothetical protein
MLTSEESLLGFHPGDKRIFVGAKAAKVQTE